MGGGGKEELQASQLPPSPYFVLIAHGRSFYSFCNAGGGVVDVLHSDCVQMII